MVVDRRDFQDHGSVSAIIAAATAAAAATHTPNERRSWRGVGLSSMITALSQRWLLMRRHRCGTVDVAGRRAVCRRCCILPMPCTCIVDAAAEAAAAVIGASNQVDEREATLAKLLANF